MKFILGSASKTRQFILKKLGYKFKVLTANIDEEKVPKKNPKTLVLQLAYAKAEAIQKKAAKNRLLVTCDQVAFCHGKILEKAKNLEEAEKFIRSYSGKIVDNISAVVVTNLESEKQASGVSNLRIKFKKFDEKLIQTAVSQKNVLSWSGATCFGQKFWKPYIIKMTGDKTILFGISVELMKKLIRRFD